MSRWKYVFCDLATGRELATLPMYGVTFEQKLLDVGTFEGVVPTTDPKVRARDPWTATAARRTAVFVECDNAPVWGGIIWGSTRDQTTRGIKISAATFESWLNYAYLRSDVNMIGAQLGAPSTIKGLVNTIQGYPGANLGINVADPDWIGGVGGDGTGEQRVSGQKYAAADLKPLLDVLVHWFQVWDVSIEWRFDWTRKTGGGYQLTLLVTESNLTSGRASVVLRYGPTPKGSNLLTFTDSEDGTQHPNGLVSTLNTTTDAGAATTYTTFSTADQIGVYELASGYPLLQAGYSIPSATTAGGYAINFAGTQQMSDAEMLDRLAQGNTINNLTVRPDAPALGSYAVGDPCRLEIIDVSYKEWPNPAIYDPWRIVGRKVTVGVGSTPDTVELTVVPGTDRIPNARTVPAELRRMASRIRMIEVKAGL